MLFEMCRSDKKPYVMQKFQIELKILPAYFPASLGFDDLITERSYLHKSNQRGSLSKGFIAAEIRPHVLLIRDSQLSFSSSFMES